MKYPSILLITVSASYVISANGNEINLCKSDEIEIAACQIDEPKERLISFCLDKKRDVVNYRFGKKKSMELTTKFTNENQLQRWTDVGTYTVYLGFKRGEYSYSFGIPQETINAKAFLSIKRKGERLGHDKLCVGNSFGDKNISSNAIIDIDDEDVRNSSFDFPK
ncbi:hypothetical protein JD499_00020 [Aeromonas enteropelogenes]|uniref:hypothetical protein n=2 Tax=Aeromonadaceae TaxID=84642 RepID=UPI00192004D7|nr:hypothetical protein [Aeromonas enteropelogenes]MBL0455615.1 hypothetical protein [Aeromonas enteropelogenes]